MNDLYRRKNTPICRAISEEGNGRTHTKSGRGYWAPDPTWSSSIATTARRSDPGIIVFGKMFGVRLSMWWSRKVTIELARNDEKENGMKRIGHTGRMTGQGVKEAIGPSWRATSVPLIMGRSRLSVRRPPDDIRMVRSVPVIPAQPQPP
jgi:hypothetical protein